MANRNYRRLGAAGPNVLPRVAAMEDRAPVSIEDFGADTGADDNWQAITDAMAAAAGERPVLIPEGVWFLRDTLRPPSNTVLMGRGWQSVLKMRGDVGREKSLVVTGDMADTREHIRVQDLMLDFNQDRWGITGASIDYERDSNQSCLVVSSTKYCWVERVKAVWARKHGINISGSDNVRGDDDPFSYSAFPSRFVWVTDCLGQFAGDDCITTHMVSDVWITRCVAKDAQADFVGNSNGIEIDDGSRNIWVTDCTVYRCNYGFETKGHFDTPAPYNVYFSGTNTAVNCNASFNVRHTGFQSGEPISATARNVYCDTIKSVAPRQANPKFSAVVRHVRITSYENVHIKTLIMTDGSEDLDAQEILPQDTLTGNMCWLFGNAKNIRIDDVFLKGVPNADKGIYVTASFGGGVYIGHLTVRDGPVEALHFFTEVTPAWVMSFDIEGSGQQNGIRLSGGISASNFKYVGPGVSSGYSTAVLWNSTSYSNPIVGIPTDLVTAGSVNP